MAAQSPRPSVSQRIVLARRPQGEPVAADFRMEEVRLPPLEEGEILLQTLFLSLDPYVRGMMDAESDDPTYAAPMDVGQVIVGGTVNRVIESRNPEFRPGELVTGGSGWQEYQITTGRGLRRISPEMENPQYTLSVLGMPGFTAYHGLMNIGRPQAGETVVLAASTGAVGSLVGQIAKIQGCRVVGIAGGPVKCAYAVDTLGYDASVDHRDPRMPELLADACPDGIDVYFENVGGPVFDAVLPLLNIGARIPLCGLIAQYNMQELPPGPDRMPLLQMAILANRLLVQGFIISDNYVVDGVDNREFWTAEISRWLDSGAIHYREDITQGLENAPSTFAGMLVGTNFGKTLIQVAR